MAKKKAIPPHFSSLSLKKFRGFQSAKDIELRPLTFLVDPVDDQAVVQVNTSLMSGSAVKSRPIRGMVFG